jgi:hypothetical protein
MKGELGLPDTQDDANLTRLMTALEGRFESHLNRLLARSVAETEYLDGGSEYLLLKRFPVESVTSVHVSADQTWDATTLWASDTYVVNNLRGRIIRNVARTAWSEGAQNIRVIYAGGYVAAGDIAAAGQYAAPEGLRLAFIMQCSFLWRNRADLGRSQINAQGAGINLAPAELLPEVTHILNEFKRY